MNIYHNHLRDMPDGLRMFFRSRHIYILLAGLINVGLGAYFTDRIPGWRRILQRIGSALIVLATILLIAAFFYEPTHMSFHTPLADWGIYSILGGTLLHLFSGFREAK